jgi:glycosyltransferase involved in cell wall biosynthesis
MRKKKVFFVTDSNSEITRETKFFGASKKIRIILSLLMKQGYIVYIIKSGPDMGIRQPICVNELLISKGKKIKCLTIPRYYYNKFGRLKNIFDARSVLQSAVNKFGVPDLVWCYNAYAFQMHFASLAKQQYKSKVVLEFEDWHFSRSGIFNPKAILDWYFWRKAIPFIDYCYAVNPWIEEKMKKNGIDSFILPGILSQEIVNLKPNVYKKKKKILHIGYFGGLNAEKGGLLLLELVNLCKDQGYNFKFHITGNGDLMPKFDFLSKSYNELIKYYGVVDDKTFNNIIGKMDILLNPHLQNKGILPFKLLEGIASGRIVLSGPLNLSGTSLEWLLQGVRVVNLKAQLWLDEIIKISKKSNLYDEKLKKIRKKTIKLYSPDGFGLALSKLPSIINL